MPRELFDIHHMRHATLYQTGIRISLAVTVFSSYGQAPLDSTIPPAPACPAPKIDTKQWKVVTLNSCRIRLKLPKKYKEHTWDVVINDAVGHSYRAGNFDSIDVGLEKPPNPNPDQNKTIRQKDYEGFTECKEVINGREAILQSFRGGGVIISAGRHFRTYYAEGLWSLRPGQLIRVRGDVTSRESQEEVLAILRTVEFIEK
jgi:hypothetical protein